MARRDSTAARVGALGVAVGARTRDRGGPTIADLVNGERIAYYLAEILRLEHSRAPDDQQAVRVAALRAGALWPRPDHPGHPDAGLLGAVLWEEEDGAPVDDVFWSLLGGRPESHHKHDVAPHRPGGGELV